MGFFEALFGALEPVQTIAKSGSGFASSFGFVFQPPYQPGYKVTDLPGGKLALGAWQTVSIASQNSMPCMRQHFKGFPAHMNPSWQNMQGSERLHCRALAAHVTIHA